MSSILDMPLSPENVASLVVLLRGADRESLQRVAAFAGGLACLAQALYAGDEAGFTASLAKLDQAVSLINAGAVVDPTEAREGGN
jgi:hypothetical protein